MTEHSMGAIVVEAEWSGLKLTVSVDLMTKTKDGGVLSIWHLSHRIDGLPDSAAQAVVGALVLDVLRQSGQLTKPEGTPMR